MSTERITIKSPASKFEPVDLQKLAEQTRNNIRQDIYVNTVSHILTALQQVATSNNAEIEAIRSAILPVKDWYNPEGEYPSRPLPDVVKDIVSDLQSDRADSLKLKAANQKIEELSRDLARQQQIAGKCQHDAEQSRKEAARRDEKWMAGIEEVCGCKINFGMTSIDIKEPTLEEYIHALKTMLVHLTTANATELNDGQ
jgi:hypothetical protein